MGNSLEYDSLIEILFSVLPLQQAMLITQKDVFSYTVKEIACMLRTNEEAIKTSLHRSRKRLKTTSIDSVTHAHTKLGNQQLFLEISLAIKENHPMKLFLYSGILSSRNYHVRRNNYSSSFHVADPDGNILEIVS
ncbi:sigma factor-like helix-turn-helix DNA-binding protein [Rossellomorea vietnamensis]|nr:sigma factor-like helix-turn-helix DNA-binding protein [Rossellomorea vietnamensis]